MTACTTARVGMAGILVLALAIAALVRAAPPAHAYGGTFHVAPDGDDRRGGSAERPWRTIRWGFKQLKPGDTLLVHGGYYDEVIDPPGLAKGTRDNRVTVLPYEGARVVVRGQMRLVDADYWTISGIDVTWKRGVSKPDRHMVKLLGGQGWEFREAEVWGARSYSAVFVGRSDAGPPSDWKLRANCIHDTVPTHRPFRDHNVYVSTGLRAGAGLIERNLVFGAPNGENVKLAGGGSGDDTANVTVRYNTLYDAAQNLLIGGDSRSNRIAHNLMGRVTGKRFYPNVHGFRLTGRRNVVEDNVGWDARRLIYNSPESTRQIVDGGGNRFGLKPRFDSRSSCDGFHPSVRKARRYGRYAP